VPPFSPLLSERVEPQIYSQPANSSDSISVIVLSLGYESESASSTPNKRVINYSQRHI
jgi:hypothetical protein